MSYTITTVSRRRFMVKTKSKQKSTPSASESGAVSGGASAGKASEPELFLRTPYRRPLRSAPTPWWSNWLAITLVNALVVAVVGGLYVWANGADNDTGGYVPRRLTVRSPPPTSVSSAPAVAAPASPPAAAVARQAAAPSVSEEIDRAVREGNRKVVLPANVAGNCSVGGNGVKDFGRCLAENGGRAQ